MKISKYNQEGYYDPTSYTAITNIIKEEKAERKAALKPLVHSCSPYSGNLCIWQYLIKSPHRSDR